MVTEGFSHQSFSGPDKNFFFAFFTDSMSFFVVVSARERLSTNLVSVEERLGEWSTKILQGIAYSRICRT